MGIHNRDYMQDDSSGPRSRGGWGGGSARDMVTTLIIINVVVLVAQLVSADRVTEWFALDVRKVLRGEVWRLFTYDFLHSTDGLNHILWNMLLLYMAGRGVEEHYGRREFLWFYLVAGWVSGLFFVVWDRAVASNLPGYAPGACVGASGAVLAVMILYSLNWPHAIWRLFGIIPVPVWLLALLDLCEDLFPLLKELGGVPVPDRIAHAAHLGGILFAFLYWRNNWRAAGWFERFQWQKVRKAMRRKPKLRVHAPDDAPEPSQRHAPIPEDVEVRVDQLLAKIAEQGEASLTPQEREYLTSASRRYRERR